jgi:hypothetical protein
VKERSTSGAQLREAEYHSMYAGSEGKVRVQLSSTPLAG